MSSRISSTYEARKTLIGQKIRRFLTLLLVLFIALITIAALGREEQTQIPSAANNPTRNGAQAVARVLQAQGTKIIPTVSPEEVIRLSTKDRPVLIVDPVALAPNMSAAVKKLPSVIFLGAPFMGENVEDGFDTDYSPDNGDFAIADCAHPAAVAAGEISIERHVVKLDNPQDWTACFHGNGQDPTFVERTFPDGRYRGLIANELLAENWYVTASGNAAFLLNYLGQWDEIIWYTPSFGYDLSTDRIVEPSYFRPALILVCAAIIAWGIARGRRLGRLVADDYPSAVPAAETLIGRGRLLRRSRDFTYLATSLRSATARRISARLGLGQRADDATLRAALLSAGLAPDLVDSALFGPVPSSTKDLTDLSTQLKELEVRIHND